MFPKKQERRSNSLRHRFVGANCRIHIFMTCVLPGVGFALMRSIEWFAYLSGYSNCYTYNGWRAAVGF